MKTGAQCLLIVNPRSGTSDKGRVIKHAIERLLSIGISVETAFTERPAHATELAAAAASEGVDIVVAIGGDGTVNETARALCNSSSVLGIIPTGSGNGLARHLNIPMDPLKAIGVITDGRVEQCDYCTVNDRPFFCTFGMGFDAAVSGRFASRPGNRGLINYVRSAIEELIHFRADEYTISCADGTLTEKAFLIACCNASQYGNNAFIAPAASIRDGLLDITIVHRGTLLEHAMSGIEIITGSIGNHGKVQTFRAPEVTIRRAKGTIAHIDGDPIELPGELNVRVCPGRLKIFTTTRKRRFKPIVTPLALMLRDWHITIHRLLHPLETRKTRRQK